MHTRKYDLLFVQAADFMSLQYVFLHTTPQALLSNFWQLLSFSVRNGGKKG